MREGTLIGPDVFVRLGRQVCIWRPQVFEYYTWRALDITVTLIPHNYSLQKKDLNIIKSMREKVRRERRLACVETRKWETRDAFQLSRSSELNESYCQLHSWSFITFSEFWNISNFKGTWFLHFKKLKALQLHLKEGLETWAFIFLKLWSGASLNPCKVKTPCMKLLK